MGSRLTPSWCPAQAGGLAAGLTLTQRLGFLCSVPRLLRPLYVFLPLFPQYVTVQGISGTGSLRIGANFLVSPWPVGNGRTSFAWSWAFGVC